MSGWRDRVDPQGEARAQYMRLADRLRRETPQQHIAVSEEPLTPEGTDFALIIPLDLRRMSHSEHVKENLTARAIEVGGPMGLTIEPYQVQFSNQKIERGIF